MAARDGGSKAGLLVFLALAIIAAVTNPKQDDHIRGFSVAARQEGGELAGLMMALGGRYVSEYENYVLFSVLEIGEFRSYGAFGHFVIYDPKHKDYRFV